MIPGLAAPWKAARAGCVRELSQDVIVPREWASRKGREVFHVQDTFMPTGSGDR